MEFDPLCIPVDKDTRSINVISLEEKDVKVSVLLKEVEAIQTHHYELLLPLTPIQRLWNIVYASRPMNKMYIQSNLKQ